MSVVIRPVMPAEYETTLDLWDSVFRPHRDYFERYFRDDPWYREGDSLGAWVDDRLASTVHVCRRPLEGRGRTLWCGAIANVATHSDYRRRGLSRELLREAMRHMERERFDFAMLFTGSNSHYEPLGWETVHTPELLLTLQGEHATTGLLSQPWSQPELDTEMLYAAAPHRPLHFLRNAPYQAWVDWVCVTHQLETLTWRNQAYAHVNLEPDDNQPATIIEWRAMDAEAEAGLLRKVARWSREQGKSQLRLAGLPQWLPINALREWGEVEIIRRDWMMLHNVRLPEPEYAQVRTAYETGEAVWWRTDGF